MEDVEKNGLVRPRGVFHGRSDSMFSISWRKAQGTTKFWASSRQSRTIQRRRSYRPALEPLEDRCLPSYAIVDLGAFTATAINNADQIAGAANSDAALWQNG